MYTIFGVSGLYGNRNGTPHAPFSGPPRPGAIKMVHYVHHFSDLDGPWGSKWYTGCTIPTFPSPDFGRNGTPGVPFQRASPGGCVKMVHRVHQSLGSWDCFELKWCITCTNISRFVTFGGQNGTPHAPILPNLTAVPRRLAH